MPDDQLLLKFVGHTATMTLNRPSKRNALSWEMWTEIPHLIKEVRTRGARALVVTGGADFSAGADISALSSARDIGGFFDATRAAAQAIAELNVPTIAAITGVCIGGGCDIALACDIRLCARDSRFAITPAKLGVVYDFAATRRLMTAVGESWSKQMLFSADFVDAATAQRIGLVNEVHSTDAVVARAMDVGTTISSRAAQSVEGAKTIIGLISGGVHEDTPRIMDLYERARGSGDYAEGMAAFLEKRAPKFSRAPPAGDW